VHGASEGLLFDVDTVDAVEFSVEFACRGLDSGRPLLGFGHDVDDAVGETFETIRTVEVDTGDRGAFGEEAHRAPRKERDRGELPSQALERLRRARQQLAAGWLVRDRGEDTVEIHHESRVGTSDNGLNHFVVGAHQPSLASPRRRGRLLRKSDGETAALIPELARIVGLRNVLAHGYAVVDDSVVWAAASGRVPVLLGLVDELLS
jgi:hypothetical protein